MDEAKVTSRESNEIQDEIKDVIKNETKEAVHEGAAVNEELLDSEESYIYINPTPKEKKPAPSVVSTENADDKVEDKDFVTVNLNSSDTTGSKSNSNYTAPVKYKKKMSKKAKKAIKWVIIIGVIIGAIIIYAQYAAYKLLYDSELFKPTTEQAAVERRDLQSTISTTGTIQSKDIRTLTSALSGVTIDEVNYEVGDIVQEGSVVVAFSREDINKKMSELSDDINQAKSSQSLDSANRDTNYTYNYGVEAYSLANASTRTQQAYEDVLRAQEELDIACADRTKTVDEYNEAVTNRDATRAALNETERFYALWKSTNTIPIPGSEEYVNWGWLGEENAIEYFSYLTTEDAWTNRISDLNTQLSEYETTIRNYDSALSNRDSTVRTRQDQLTTAQRNYETALVSENKTNYDSANNIKKYDYNYAKENLTAGNNVETLERQYSDYEDKLDDYIVYAPITGLVTSVNAQEGNGYQATSGALMTIQAIDSFEVTTQIDEYDINSVALGQEVVIRTDATGDDDLKGEVTFISPTATATQTAGLNNTYEVKINVLTDDPRLKLGMSAKLNIITDSHNDVLAVRYDAIDEKSNGEHVVYVVEGESAGTVGGLDPKNFDMSGAKSGSGAGDNDGILVVGVDGSAKVTGTPSSNSSNVAAKNGKNKGNEKPSFLKYLFSNKDDLDVMGDVEAKKDAKEVVVTIGIEGDYYTEISSDEIKEGTVLLVTSNNGQMQNALMQMLGGMEGSGGPGGPGGF